MRTNNFKITFSCDYLVDGREFSNHTMIKRSSPKN